MNENPTYAAVTLLTDSRYVPGARVLGYSLKRSGWKHDTVALVTPAVDEAARQKLAPYWNRIAEVEPIGNPEAEERRGLPAYATVYTKLQVWNLTEHERIVYLDADTVVTGELEELLGRGEFAAAPCTTAPDLFNTGVLVVKPSKERFEDLVGAITRLPSYDGSDQGFLNSYFADWFTGPPERRLPIKFNVPRMLHIYQPAWNRIEPDMRVLHFLGRQKPWDLEATKGKPVLKPSLVRKIRNKTTVPPMRQYAGRPYEIWMQFRRELGEESPRRA